MDKVKAIVLFAKPWRFVDENTGQVKEGITVEYVMTDNLVPVNNEDGSVGYEHVRQTLHVDNAKKIEKVPGIYDMTFGYTVIKGRPVMKLQTLKFVSEVI